MRGDAREQLSRPKRLVDVVVGPDLEPQDDITLLVIRVLEPTATAPESSPEPETVAAI